MREFTRDTLQFLLDVYRYGDLALTYYGPFPIYIANSPDVIHDILVEQAARFYKSTQNKSALDPILGSGVFTSDGDLWKRQRKLVQPAFHARRIGAYADIMVKYAVQMVDRWESGATLEIDREMTALTMSVITKAMFGADVSSEAKAFTEILTPVLEIANKRLDAVFPLPVWIPTPNNLRLKAAVAKIDRILQRFIDDRRMSGEDTGDLLSMLLMAQDADDGETMSDKQVRDEAITVFGAGHETTATALMWTWYLLSQHSEVEAKLLAELDSVLGGRTPTLDDLPNLPYTEMVVKEAMRLYPPAFAAARDSIADVTVAGYRLKKGSPIIINIYGVHRDERYFPNPEQFIPERFSPENEKNIPKYAYLPFGAGPRVCLGNMFAMMEARLILATVAQRVRLSLAPGHPVVPGRVFTLRPKNGLKMNVSLRDPVRTATTSA
jgi:cytochrome P450